MSDNDADIETPEDEVPDVADRLTRLMRRIIDTAKSMQFPRPDQPNRTYTGLQRPLHEVFEPLAVELGFSDYAELRDNFVSLCKRTIRDISSLSIKRSETQARWINAAETANGVFNASNFAQPCSTIFDQHFSQEVFHRLEDASERLQQEGRRESSQDQLKEALEAARQAMEAYESEGKIPSDVSKILKHYLQQIEGAYARYDDFGEELFWSTYKEMFATFVQIHPHIMPEGENKAVKTAMQKMREKMHYGIQSMSIAADALTITTTGAILLGAVI